MLLACVRVLAIVTVALYLVPTGAHLFELAGKLALSPADYMTVQGSTGLGAVRHRGIRRDAADPVARDPAPPRTQRLHPVAGRILLSCGTQVVFWVFTYPMNVASSNWTVTPEHFEAARRQWEYSHAASAMLTFLALIAIASAGGGRSRLGRNAIKRAASDSDRDCFVTSLLTMT